MSNLFSKHLHLCFFKLKHHTTILPQPSPSPASTPNSTTTFHFNATFTHSLYDTTTSSALSTSKSTDDYFSSSSSSSDSLDPPPLPPPDFASVFASQRFFFSSPGNSNSIIESPDKRRRHNNTLSVASGGVRVPKYSINPYVDFLRSMQEMIRSRQELDVTKDWEYLHELLLCYLALNPTNTHKYIVRAFTDLVVDLLCSSSSSSSSSSLSSLPSSPPVVKSTSCRKLKSRRHRSFSGQLV